MSDSYKKEGQITIKNYNNASLDPSNVTSVPGSPIEMDSILVNKPKFVMMNEVEVASSSTLNKESFLTEEEVHNFSALQSSSSPFNLWNYLRSLNSLESDPRGFAQVKKRLILATVAIATSMYVYIIIPSEK